MANIIQALKNQKQRRPPVWFMRQAGRYLPEYLALREKYSLLELMCNSELATEVTMQPMRRFGFDAAIIFADILTPLIGMGVKLDFIEGRGPVIENPVRTKKDLDVLKVYDPAEGVAFTLDAIKGCVAQLGDTPLLGFSAAPFTLACYLVEAGAPKELENVRKLMYLDPQLFKEIQEKLSEQILSYCISQVEAGAQAIQLFDSSLGNVNPFDYVNFIEPTLVKLIDDLKNKLSVPIIYFSTGTFALFNSFRNFNVSTIGVDWHVDLLDAAAILGGKFSIQGNLDPRLLFADETYLTKAVLDILQKASDLPNAHIFNLGHGILPKTPISNVELVLDLIRTKGKFE